MQMSSTFIFVTWLGFFLLGCIVVFLIDHLFIFKKFYKPDGDFILTQINEDEATTSIKFDQMVFDSKAKYMVFRVVKINANNNKM